MNGDPQNRATELASFNGEFGKRSSSMNGNSNRISLVRSSHGDRRGVAEEPPIAKISTVGQLFGNIQEPFLCEVCGMSFSRRNALESHLSIHYGLKPYSCNVCRKEFEYRSNMYQHRKSHGCETRKPYVCDICKRPFALKNSLLKHNMVVHFGKTQAYDVRDEGFSCRSSSTTHCFLPTKRYLCEFCGKGFYRKDNFEKHLLIHGVANHECPICEKKFKRKDYVQQHIWFHFDKKPHSCEACGKTYASSSNLKRHVASHDEPKMRFYECDGMACAKRSKRSGRRYRKCIAQPSSKKSAGKIDVAAVENCEIGKAEPVNISFLGCNKPQKKNSNLNYRNSVFSVSSRLSIQSIPSNTRDFYSKRSRSTGEEKFFLKTCRREIATFCSQSPFRREPNNASVYCRYANSNAKRQLRSVFKFPVENEGSHSYRCAPSNRSASIKDAIKQEIPSSLHSGYFDSKQINRPPTSAKCAVEDIENNYGVLGGASGSSVCDAELPSRPERPLVEQDVPKSLELTDPLWYCAKCDALFSEKEAYLFHCFEHCNFNGSKPQYV